MKVLFLGLGNSCKHMNFDDYDEIWSMNDWYRVYPDLVVDRVYEPHSKEDFDRKQNGDRYHNITQNYKEKAKIVIAGETYNLPNERIIDIFELKQNFNLNFFGSSIGYMMADAIREKKIKEIHIRGIDLSIDSEYEHQVLSIMENIRVARLKGIKVICPMEFQWEERLLSTHIGNIPRNYGIMTLFDKE